MVTVVIVLLSPTNRIRQTSSSLEVEKTFSDKGKQPPREEDKSFQPIVNTYSDAQDHTDQVISEIHQALEITEEDGDHQVVDATLISAGHIVPDLPDLPSISLDSEMSAHTEQPLFADTRVAQEVPNGAAIEAAKTFAEDRQRRVYLVNSPRYHYEIVLPVLNIFSVLDKVNLTLFAHHSGYDRFGVRPWLNHYSMDKLDLRDISTVSKYHDTVPDLIFLTSCAEDTKAIRDSLTHYLERGSKVMCIVHEAQRWNLDDPDGERSKYKEEIRFMTPWIKQGKWDIVTLSSNVQGYIRENFPSYFNTGDTVKYDPPIFYPVFQLPEARILLEREWPFVAMVGKLEPWRRDYNKIFTQFEKFDPPFNLSLIGSGEPLKVPDAIKAKVRFESELDFPDFFKAVSRAAAVVPSFAQVDYLISQASSSIATSVITVTPALMTQKMLSAYSYVTEDVAWLQADEETEMEAVARIATMGPDAWWARKERLARRRDELILKNVDFLGDYLKQLKK